MSYFCFCEHADLPFDYQEVISLQDTNNKLIQPVFYHHWPQDYDGNLVHGLMWEENFLYLSVGFSVFEIGNFNVQGVWEDDVW